MPGMKGDCGGAAAILGAFRALVLQGFKENLHAIFCTAENAVGPLATRPDDIIKMYSGRTVEVNNTDAEGRLVLGDGVAYAERNLSADIIVDVATLTGAQVYIFENACQCLSFFCSKQLYTVCEKTNLRNEKCQW